MAKSKTAQQIRPRRRSFSDPFEAVLLPPANETPEQREQRLNAEYAAKLVSDNIDQMIANERNAKKKAKAEIKVLLLGQSESGKSTTLKRERAIPCPSIIIYSGHT
jgi:guanine nucleotide-binding protein alpha-1 subunit